jgi:uncharacterized protein YggU (UPF0235/DUF167 family)
MAVFEVSVVPGSARFSIALDPSTGRARVRLTEKAEGNRANVELVRELSQLLGTPVRIVRGAKARRKTLAVDLDAVKIQGRISAAAERENVEKPPRKP